MNLMSAIGGVIAVRARVRKVLLLVAVGFGTAASASAQLTDPPDLLVENGGGWIGPFDWRLQFGLASCPPQSPLEEKEISHAALLPKGPHAGKVLIWRKQINASCTQTLDSTKVYLVDPNDPDDVIAINQTLDSSIFCSGTSWQPNGNLLVAGGIPSAGLDPKPKEAYRFRPGALSATVRPDPMTGFPTIDSTPFTQLLDMLKGRYYPTLVTLNNTTLSMPDTGGSIPGGSTLVFGGPAEVSAEGSELWELNIADSIAWSAPIAPEAPINPIPPSAPPLERYSLQDTSNPPDQLFDSYPRAWQLRNGQVFIAGDVNTINANGAAGRANTPGSAWVIEHAELLQAPANPEWELWRTLPSKDRFYGTGAFFHFQQPTGKDRAVVFGGSEEQAGGWVVLDLDSVQEFEPGSNARDVNPATTFWVNKTPLMAKRLYANAVILPTGQVLIVGGSRSDYAHSPHPDINPVFWPELYDIGSLPTDPGSSTWMNMSNLTPIDPNNPGLGVARTPRVYHSTALLLLDGRVFVIGGEEEPPPPTYASPLYSGEIFSPPYLFQPEFDGERPNIFNAPPSAQFNLVNTMSRTFDIEVSRTHEANTIDRVVLLRPAAVTHHFDYDQRYIELKINAVIYNQWNPEEVQLTIESPQEDLGPAGYYMLFAIEKENAARVPSEGVFIKFTPAS